ncbi:sensor histidine kinase N-terminal domain-containing protein [Rhodoblastus sp.]|jgi:two-component system sensor histidine kinase QseC|uniref:sensor histidine kinase N-terminal domain-containing protein n=1 Tax=Rhodoblastus sp. TaxID=1962975 RepID=UPI0026191C75|nr:sensor histidine kinase N-terminal domain-containing protein [Rhodoblastus sp.]
MTSLRNRLFFVLITATCLIWLCAIFWVYLGSKAEFERAFDSRLRESAKMVASLVSSNALLAADSIDAATTNASYERQLSCQIWSLDGRLIAHSSGAPKDRLAVEESGFSDRRVDGESWRVYSIRDVANGVRVMVGDRIGMRDHLVRDLVAGLVVPALLAIPALGLVLWLGLRFELRPLRIMAEQLRDRAADDMTPIDAAKTPSEVRPLIEALNGLLYNLDAALRHDRELTAFAAHELRTPIAGLKTQAQIALAAADPAVKEGALRQIIVSVDRTTRLIRQLLTLTRLDVESQRAEGAEQVNVGEVLDEIVAAAQPKDGDVAIHIDPELRKTNVVSNREILTVALRNLHENALQHMPDSGVVSWIYEDNPCGIVIEDEGPGIPEDELPMASRRFFRGRHKSPTGAGLGLAIVELAAEQLGGRLVLVNRQDRNGLRAALCLKDRLKSA